MNRIDSYALKLKLPGAAVLADASKSKVLTSVTNVENVPIYPARQS